LRERFSFRDLCAALFTVKRRCIVDELPSLHARKDLARTFYREMDQCLLDEIGKPDRASRAGGDLSGMKIEKEHPEEGTERKISVVSTSRGNVSYFLSYPSPPSRFLSHLRNSLHLNRHLELQTYACAYVIRRAFCIPRDDGQSTNVQDILMRCD